MKKREKRETRVLSARERIERHSAGSDRTSLIIPRGANLFIPKAKTYKLDIIPYTAGKGNPFANEGDEWFERTYYAHKSVGPNNDTVVCLNKVFGKKCPGCELWAQMQKDPDLEQKEKNVYKIKERQIYNVIDVDDRDRGIQIFDMSYYLFGDMLETKVAKGEDHEYDNYADKNVGLTIRVSFEEQQGGGYTYMQAVDIEFRKRKEQYGDEIVEQAWCLDDLIKEIPYDKFKSMLLMGETEDEDEDEDDTPPPKKRDKPSVGKKRPKDDDEEDDDDDDDDDDEDDEDEDDEVDEVDEDDEEPSKKPPAKGKGPAYKMGLKVGMMVKHKKLGLVEVSRISPDGTSLTVEDDDGDEHKAIDPKHCTIVDPEEDDDDDDDTPPPKKRGGKGKPAAGKKRPKDDDEEDDDDDDDDDDEDDDDDD